MHLRTLLSHTTLLELSVPLGEHGGLPRAGLLFLWLHCMVESSACCVHSANPHCLLERCCYSAQHTHITIPFGWEKSNYAHQHNIFVHSTRCNKSHNYRAWKPVCFKYRFTKRLRVKTQEDGFDRYAKHFCIFKNFFKTRRLAGAAAH